LSRLLSVVKVQDAHLDAGDGRPDGACLANLARTVERRDRRGLGEPVAFEHLAAEALLEAVQ
jgi:hypothetical protein